MAESAATFLMATRVAALRAPTAPLGLVTAILIAVSSPEIAIESLVTRARMMRARETRARTNRAPPALPPAMA
jgi:hypothetical protein